ncbi:uncharacterized protein LOC113668553 [Pocillopora damicornis]|uniref:uncharacterized protein LOC113668553 n=1 Tax=Pocillopora damicornis TaxID=46731 RepID=UPI000F550391|nr:uncharacterized protein LOC113668553 [Pocillopora damicornis]
MSWQLLRELQRQLEANHFELESDNRLTAPRKRRRVGLESSDSESSSPETDDSVSRSDGSSDTNTDSYTEEENFGLIEEKPILAKQKVSKNTITKKQTARASNTTNKMEKNEKGASVEIPAKKPIAQPRKRKISKENTGKGADASGF